VGLVLGLGLGLRLGLELRLRLGLMLGLGLGLGSGLGLASCGVCHVPQRSSPEMRSVSEAAGASVGFLTITLTKTLQRLSQP